MLQIAVLVGFAFLGCASRTESYSWHGMLQPQIVR